MVGKKPYCDKLGDYEMQALSTLMSYPTGWLIQGRFI